MYFTRQPQFDQMFRRIEHRRGLLQAKCVESLQRESGLAEAKAVPMVEQWLALLGKLNEPKWDEAAVDFGRWAVEQEIPFEIVMAQVHYYRIAAIRVLVREYSGVEGYLEALLALDQALTLLMGKIPVGYFKG